MPRHDWFDDDTMSRDRSDFPERGYGDYDRSRREFDDRDRDRGAMFDRERDDSRDDRERGRPIGGWGGLMGDERSPDRGRHPDRERARDRRDRSSFGSEERRFGSDDHHRGLPMDETERLIASNKVEGTPVFDRHGDKLGSVHNFMVDKYRGEVVYAVLKHGGGFLGLGERYYPLEWGDLDYDTRLGGFQVDLEEEDLKSFGSFDSEGRWHRRNRGARSGESRGRGRHRERGYRDERQMREPW